MDLIHLYNDDCAAQFYLNGGMYWYIGISNTIDQGIAAFLATIKARGNVIHNGPELVCWEEVGDLHYVIVAEALPKLEYLALKAKRVGKNVKRRKTIIKVGSIRGSALKSI